VLDDKEIVLIILAAQKIGDPYSGIIELLVLTGQRRKEVARLTWEELDFEQRIWTIPTLRTKNGKSHVVHLSEQALTVLNRMERRGPFEIRARLKTLVSWKSTIFGVAIPSRSGHD
jgi:integrase